MSLRWLAWWLPPFVHRLVLVNLIGEPDTAIRGVLWRSSGPWLVFKQAALVKGGQSAPMDGEVIVHRSQILFVQAPPTV